MNNRHYKKGEISAFIKEWENVVKLLKRSQCDLSKIKLAAEVR